MKEPHERIGEYFRFVMCSDAINSDEELAVVNDLDFDKFLKYKLVWLQNLSLEWLIQGHVTE